MRTGRRGAGVVCRASPNQDGLGDGTIPSSLIVIGPKFEWMPLTFDNEPTYDN
ncbi:hypothetical protein HanHA300_Chr05g0178481 [Helianthus annuus]|nr:hypothetical protein HanHA300_Chr05g0178481 [Helianthus annuus]KAJ0584826.1 hypothetical protein HanHA89_Chr05g0193201 [Helianthus annuus]KAJ0750489.1 hypothetical protein HanLR1_Chr05g0182541 [Helianthus annuus]